MSKKQLVLGVLFAVITGVLMFVSVLQTFRFNEVVREVTVLENEQKKLLEINKRLIAGTAVLSSPGRIDHIAKDELALVKSNPNDIVRVKLLKGDQ